MKPFQDRLWSKIDKKGPEDCWPWLASTVGRGYGSVRIGASRSGKMLAHRAVYLQHFGGPIPDDLQVLHSCDNPPCCNPAHLFLGANADNMADRDAKGRGAKPPIHRGATHPRAKLTAAEAAEIRTSVGPLHETAERYGVGISQVSAIRRRISWNDQNT